MNSATAARYNAISDGLGNFAVDLLPPGDYSARVIAEGMSPQITPQLHVDTGAVAPSNSTSPSPALMKMLPSPPHQPWSKRNRRLSPPSSTNALSTIFP